MKAISIWQPWASLIASGAKQFETRSWSTSYRGPISIHAAKKDPHSVMLSLPHDTSKIIFECLYEHFGIHSGALSKMAIGSIVATAELVACWEIHASNGRGVNYKDVYINKPDSSGLDGVTWISNNERLIGNFTPGRYAWELRNVVMLPEPIPAKGSQGLWNWNEAERSQ